MPEHHDVLTGINVSNHIPAFGADRDRNSAGTGLERLTHMRHSDGKPRRLRRLLASAAVIGLAIVAAVGVGQAAYAAAPAPIHTFDDFSGLCLQPVPVNGGSIYDNGMQPSPMQEYHCTSNNNAQVFSVPPS